MARVQDLEGRVFSYLKVIDRAPDYVGPNGRRFVQWNCECLKCGNMTVARADSLRSGIKKSCGCMAGKSVNRKNTATHGMSDTRLYGFYKLIKQRCYNPNCNGYDLYGGNGIRVCDEWILDVENFLVWSLDHGYTDEKTLHLIDANKDYSPTNCEWLTKEEVREKKPKRIRKKGSGKYISRLFSTENVTLMVQGKKRLLIIPVKPQPLIKNATAEIVKDVSRPTYRISQMVAVRETYAETADGYIYKASKGQYGDQKVKWIPNLFMPEDAVRYYLKIKGIGLKKISELTTEEMQDAGIGSTRYSIGRRKEEFKRKWDVQYKDYPSASNPWAWIYEFELVGKEKR